MLTSINKKRIFIIIFILLNIFFPIYSYATVSPTNNFYVNDYANVLSSDTEEYIINTNQKLNKKTKAQIVVVTVKSLDGKSIEEYATELFRKFGIGDNEKNNGVLLLCSTGDRLFRIEVGYGLEGVLNDAKTGRIQDQYIIPYLKENNYNEGIRNGFNAIVEEVCKEYDIIIEGTEEAEIVGNVENDSIFETFGTTWLFILIVISITFRIIVDLKCSFEKSIILKIIYCFLVMFISWLIIKEIFISLALAVMLTFGRGARFGRWKWFFWGRLFRRWRIFRRRRKYKKLLIILYSKVGFF